MAALPDQFQGQKCQMQVKMHGHHLSRNHVHEEVNNAVGVAPLVVVPGNNLEETLLTLQVVLQGSLGVIDRGVHVVDEVRGHQLLISVGKDTLHVGLGGCLQELVDLFDGGILLSKEGEVNHGDIWGRHTEGHAGELALGGRQHLAHSLGSAGGRRDDVAGSSTASTPVLGRDSVHGLLGGSVGVDSGHETLLDADAFLHDHVAEWSQAVRGARGVGHDVVSTLVVLGVVHTAHQGLHLTLAWSRNDHLLGTSIDVALGLLRVHKDTGGLDDVVHAHATPWQRAGTIPASLDALDLVAVHNQLIGSSNLNVMLELAMGRVILHLVSKVLGISGHVNNTDNVELGAQEALVADGLEDHAANAAKSVDAHSCRHD
mmetsp:Transcript_45009/g.80964  ORF Transcript_45009/g.80964 Transcript_45009/m.80964 type:complete len:373 (+) Transcript_45009:169-1287(+)